MLTLEMMVAGKLAKAPAAGGLENVAKAATPRPTATLTYYRGKEWGPRGHFGVVLNDADRTLIHASKPPWPYQSLTLEHRAGAYKNSFFNRPVAVINVRVKSIQAIKNLEGTNYTGRGECLGAAVHAIKVGGPRLW
jgi:hypothetical protein